MVPPVSPCRDLVTPLVSFPCDPMAPPVSPPRNPAAPLVSPLWGPAAPPVIIFCVLAMPAAAPASAPVLRTSSSDWFVFIRLHVEVVIANPVGAGLVRTVNPLHRLPFRFHLQSRLAGPPLARHHDSHCLNLFLRYLLARVHEHVV